MTSTIAPLARAVTWSRVDDGFYVGSRTGAFIGHIEQVAADRFIATDGRGQRVGNFGTVTAARDHLTARAA